ncbi:MAG TPA: NHL repeat-containing protein [Candidatus Cybelea sp.]|jgi:serine/threonine-protein kinase
MKDSLALSAIAAGALFAAAGCSAAGTSAIAPPAAQPGASARNHGRPLPTAAHDYVYVADAYASTVWIFPAKGFDKSPVGSITTGVSGPEGMAVDSTGNLYVTNTSAATVTIYPPGSSQPSLTLSQDLVTPAAVAVDSRGNVWVSNEDGGYTGSVVEFPPGSTKPSQVITGLTPYGVAVDSKGNLYVAGDSNGAASISVYPPGKTKPSKQFGQSELYNPYGVIVGPNGDIEVCDWYLDTVFIYKHGSYKLLRQVYAGSSDAGQLTLAKDHRLYVANDDSIVVTEIGHNGFGHLLQDRLFTNLNSAFGIAADPEVVPGP